MNDSIMNESILSKKRHIFCLLVIAALLGLTLWFLFRNHELKQIGEALNQLNVLWLLLGAGAVLLFFSLEGLALNGLLKSLGAGSRFPRRFGYALTDFYFSSITPACCGGQPAQIWFMHRDGIPIARSSQTLLVFNMAYHFVLFVAGILFLLLGGVEILRGTGVYFWLFFFGLSVRIALVLAYWLAVFHPRIAGILVDFGIKILGRLHLIKDRQQTLLKARRQVEMYRAGADYLHRHPALMLRTLALVAMHLLTYYSLAYLVYRSFSLQECTYIYVVATQLALTMCVESLPIPGGMGVTEAGFLLFYQKIFPSELVLTALLLCRGLNYYLGLVLGASSSLICFLHPLGEKNKDELSKNMGK